MRPRVYIAYTGGTIGMRRGPNGYVPVPGYLAEQMARIPELQDDSMPLYTIREDQPLLDSSNMTPRDWWRIAADIAAYHDQYDGFVVLHGTDTMAFSASALAFLLDGLKKPVILTGSQIPLCEVRTDGRENLITAVQMAGTIGIPEVTLYFGDKLLRGCRSVKVDAEGFDAFASPNLPPLARVGVEIDVDQELVRPVPEVPLQVVPYQSVIVGTLRLFPGLSANLVRNILQAPLQGLVLEGYGVGNGPDNDAAFLRALEEATERGVVILDRTQCLRGGVRLKDYATGLGLAGAGVVSAHDMTVEAAITKLYWLLAQSLSPEQVRRRLQVDYRGELTRPDDILGRRLRLKRMLV